MKLKKLTRVFFTLLLICTMTFFAVGCSTKESKNPTDLTISAAASLKEVMGELSDMYRAENPDVTLTFNFGSSGSLQQQIEQGAPSDIFISAGKKQMKALADKGLLVPDTDKNLVKNTLVLVTSKESVIEGVNDLTTDKVKKIAIGEPKSVPAGKYADEALTKLSLKDKVNSKLVFAKDVKEVFAWTASGNADAGFVYASDALNKDGVKVIETVSEESHSPIMYPIAVIKSSKNVDAAKAFEDFLLSEKAQKVFEKYGYKSAK